jgi:Ca2+/Na+ antiporter
MERRTKATASAGVKRKSRKSLVISLIAVAVVIALLIMEQVAVLYVLATLSVAGLLIIVAWSDLGQSKRVATDAPPRDDAAAIADGVAAPTTAYGTAAARRGTAK